MEGEGKVACDGWGGGGGGEEGIEEQEGLEGEGSSDGDAQRAADHRDLHLGESSGWVKVSITGEGSWGSDLILRDGSS